VDQPASGEYVEPRQLPLASAGARWLSAAAVLGSGMALLDGTVGSGSARGDAGQSRSARALHCRAYIGFAN
jgi:hypothetical protein